MEMKVFIKLYQNSEHPGYDIYKNDNIYISVWSLVQHAEKYAKEHFNFKEQEVKTLIASYKKQYVSDLQWLALVLPEYVDCNKEFQENPEEFIDRLILGDLDDKYGVFPFDYFLFKEQFVIYR